MLCFAAKFLGEKRMHFHAGWDGDQAHTDMVVAAWELLDEADVVMTFNGKRFDIPWLNYEFVTLGLTPPAPYDQIDLYEVAKRHFRFASNKLQHVSTSLGLKGKAEHEGFKLWLSVMAGDKLAQRRMRRYNEQDTRLLEALYGILMPWIHGHPSRNLYDGTSDCPICGAAGIEIQRRGFAYTKVSKFQKYQCTECGGWLRSGKRLEGVNLRRVA